MSINYLDAHNQREQGRVFSLELLLQIRILWCLQTAEFIPLSSQEAAMVALFLCLHEVGTPVQFDYSHPMGLKVCVGAGMRPHTHTSTESVMRSPPL